MLVLERIARVGRLQFLRANKWLRRVPTKIEDKPKPKMVFQVFVLFFSFKYIHILLFYFLVMLLSNVCKQDSQAPRDPIQALFVGVAQEEVEGGEGKRGKPRKPEIQMRFFEGEEVCYSILFSIIY